MGSGFHRLSVDVGTDGTCFPFCAFFFVLGGLLHFAEFAVRTRKVDIVRNNEATAKKDLVSFIFKRNSISMETA